MIRLTVTLCVAIYIVLIVIPDPDHADNVTQSQSTGQNWIVAMITDAEYQSQRPPRYRASASAEDARHSLTDDLLETATGFALVTENGRQLEIAQVIDPAELVRNAEENAVSMVSLVARDPDAPAIERTREIWRVAASAVNFRDGPSTNTRVLTSLRRGEEVELIASADDDWARLRVLSSGLEGYMASQFLEPVN